MPDHCRRRHLLTLLAELLTCGPNLFCHLGPLPCIFEHPSRAEAEIARIGEETLERDSVTGRDAMFETRDAMIG
jgi:hypothetical protein